MQIKYMDWRSDLDVDEERLALTYHHNSNHYPQFEVLTRSRMKMLKRLFSQMNQTVTPAKRHFASKRYSMDSMDRNSHSFIADLVASLDHLQDSYQPFKDFESMQELGVAEQLDGLDIYFLSKSQVHTQYELFYCSPAEGIIEHVKEKVESTWWESVFHSSLDFRDGDGAIFITANINRSMKLFGERGYRLSLLEGGRLTERLTQCAQASKINLTPVMTFYDKSVHDVLGIDGYYDVVLTSLIFRKEE